MHITDERPAGLFSRRFWTQPRPATGLDRRALVWIIAKDVGGVLRQFLSGAAEAAIGLTIVILGLWKFAGLI